MLLKRVTTWAAAALALSIIVVMAPADSTGAQTFNPVLEVEFDDLNPEVPSDFTVDFSVPKGDVNFGAVVAFLPGDAGIVRGDKIPIGTDVGMLRATSTLGLFNSPCNQTFLSQFDFKNASINITDTVPYTDSDENFIQDWVEDKNNDGNQDAIDKYPDWLNRIFENQQPIRRQAAITLVAGVNIILQFVIFEPGTKIDDDIPSDPSLGYPTAVVLLNLTDPGAELEPIAITDFCAPLTTQTFAWGESPDGLVLSVNPQPGEYTFTAIAQGLVDADGDGWENALDTCPFDKNVGDPRVPKSGDADSDGLDAACDPDDDATLSDFDNDGYLNRGDNCPLEPNGQEDESNQADEDLDQIGDACDPNPSQRDGELISLEIPVAITVGGGGPGGPPSEEVCPDCYRPGETLGSDDGGTGTGVIVGIIAGVGAAVLVIGGAAYVLMKRGS